MSSPDAALAQLGMEQVPTAIVALEEECARLRRQWEELTVKRSAEGIEQVVGIEPAPDSPKGASTVATVATGDTKDTHAETRVSTVTFDQATAATERTPGGTPRKVQREDVRAVFRASSTTGRVTIEQIQRIKMMHEKIANGVDFDFNYCCLLMVASIVAGLGLALNSSTTVISSMLLSPIM